ncbi:unnamed protein product [Symbiodinium sp. CCMP2592]|nr:unnamed protein product [Symbiodinium sp. CCMP2592]
MFEAMINSDFAPSSLAVLHANGPHPAMGGDMQTQAQRFPSVPDVQRSPGPARFRWDKDNASMVCFDRPHVKFEGVSCTHADYKPPPLSALRSFVDGHVVNKVEERFPQPQLEARCGSGESESHSRYKAPPSDAYRADILRPRSEYWEACRFPDRHVPIQRTSCTHDSFRAPPLADLRQPAVVDCHMQGAETKVFFSGESTVQADYKAPPPDVAKLAMEGGQPPPTLPIGDPSARFEGQSRTHCDYQPPPLEAFRVTSALPTLLCPDMQPSIPFVGQSSMHADYAAPPVAPLTAFSAPVPHRQSAAQDLIHPHPGQKSVSTAHHDYKAPGLEQLRQALVQSGMEAPQMPLPRTKFEGESCTHRDFQAPPSVIPEFRAPLGDAMPAVRELLQPTAGTLNESTTQHDYRARPLGSWYQDLSSTREETIPLPRTRFQGESTVQADYKAPPPDVAKLAMEGGQPPPTLPIGDPSARFEGQSRTHCDYQPPPLEAFRVTSALPTLLCPDMQPSIPFVGQSSMHADYAAPPVAPLTAFSAPVPHRQSAAQDLIHPHPGQKSVSTAHHDYKAPGLEQLRQALVQSGMEAPQMPLPRTKFEGESCTHRDFQAPPSVIPEFRAPLGDAMPAVRELLQPTAGTLNESTTQHDYRAPPLGSWYQDLSSTREETIPLPRTRFQGESTVQADYKAPPPDVAKLAIEGGQPPPTLPIGDPSARFEGQSRTHCDYQPPPLEALMLSLKADDTARVQEEATFSSTHGGAFEGVSTSHHDFLQPPKEAYPKKPSRRASKLDGEPAAPLQNLWEWLHSAEQTSASPNESSMRADYKAPPPAAPADTQFKSGQETQESQHAIHFEATSSMRSHYPPPPAEALSIAPADVRSRQGDLRDSFVLATKFEGESTAQRDFVKHPVGALPDLCPTSLDSRSIAENPPFQGESSMRAHYPAPPPDAFRIATADSRCRQDDLQHSSVQAASFEGESTAHRDFQKHPVPVEELPDMSQMSRDASKSDSHHLPFEGESSMRAHYPAPPPDAFRVAPADVRSRWDDMMQSSVQAARFEGESTAHRDFQQHPVEALPELCPTSLDSRSVAENPPFQGESSMRAHYPAPPPDAFRIATADSRCRQDDLQHSSVQAASFEGESTAHRDFQKHPVPVEELPDMSQMSRDASKSDSHHLPFEGESSMRAHYPAPPPDAFRVAPADVRSRWDDMMQSSVQAARFEGESTAHRDFQQHPVEALAELCPTSLDSRSVAENPPFQGESSMRAHYPAPPPDAFRIATADSRCRQDDLQHSSVQAASFEGESTAHRDFQAHPMQAVPELAPDRSVVHTLPFEGESSMQSHYRAPPQDAFKVAPADARSRQGDLQHSSAQAAQFEGESTAHRDFQAHPVPALPELLPDNSGVHTLPFEGESSMQAHYKAPPQDAFKVALADARSRQGDLQHSSAQAAQFEGESTAHRDFQAHPVQAVPELAPDRSVVHTLPFEGESSMQSHYRAPPQDAFKVAPADARSRQGDLQHSSAQAAQFEGESTAHRDFQAHPVQAVPELAPDRSVVHTLPFEGESSMQSHYRAPPQDAFKVAPADARSRQGDLQHSSAQAAQFEGESTAHRDFQAHPVQAVPELAPDRSVVHTLLFEGESSMQSHYRAPPQDAFKVAPADARSRQGDLQHSCAQAAQFEGESTAHRDFQAHPVQAVPELSPDRSVVHILPFEGESSMQSHYRAPPQDAFKVAPADARSRAGDLRHSCARAVKFEGESTAHRDFQAHPVPALPELPPDNSRVHALPFEGESSMQAHYKAPPQDAFKVALADARSRQGHLPHSSAQAAMFEGGSTAHRDFQAHPVQALPELLPDRSVVHTLPFEGESSMQSHYKAPPQDAFKVAPADARPRQGDLQHSSAQAAQFEGESTAHRDFQAHPVQAVPELAPDRSVVHTLPFEGESSMQSHYRAPPQDAFKVAPADARSRQGYLQHSSAQAAQFEGESTAHRDFQAHPVQALPELPPDSSVVHTLPFEGESSMQSHYRAPPQDAFKVAPADAFSRQGYLQHSSAQAAQFEDESTAHRDFRAHPVPALQEARPESSIMPCHLPFEGQSSMRAHYQAPPPDACNFAPVHAQSRQVEMQHGLVEAAKFEGESTARRDFQAPPMQALKHFPTLDSRSLPCSLPFEGTSSMRAHYQPPPRSAFLLQTQHIATPVRHASRSQGTITARSDSQAHGEPGQQHGQGQVAAEASVPMVACCTAPSPETLPSASWQQPAAGRGGGILHRPNSDCELVNASSGSACVPPFQLGTCEQEPSVLTYQEQDRPNQTETGLQVVGGQEAPSARTHQSFKVPSLDRLRAILQEAEACCTETRREDYEALGTGLEATQKPDRSRYSPGPGCAPDLRRPVALRHLKLGLSIELGLAATTGQQRQRRHGRGSAIETREHLLSSVFPHPEAAFSLADSARRDAFVNAVLLFMCGGMLQVGCGNKSTARSISRRRKRGHSGLAELPVLEFQTRRDAPNLRTRQSRLQKTAAGFSQWLGAKKPSDVEPRTQGLEEAKRESETQQEGEFASRSYRSPPPEVVTSTRAAGRSSERSASDRASHRRYSHRSAEARLPGTRSASSHDKYRLQQRQAAKA